MNTFKINESFQDIKEKQLFTGKELEEGLLQNVVVFKLVEKKMRAKEFCRLEAQPPRLRLFIVWGQSQNQPDRGEDMNET